MSDSIKSVMNVQASRVNLNPSVVLRKLSDVEVLRKTTPDRLRKTGKERASVSADTDKSLEVHEVQSRSGSEKKQDTQKKVEVTKPHPKSTEENPCKEKPSKATEVAQKKVAKPVNETKSQHKPTESGVINSVKESVKEVVDQEAATPSRSTITEDLLTQISLSAPVKDVEKVVQVLSSDNITEKSDKTEGRSKLMAKDSQKVSTSKEAEVSSKMATVMTESRNLSVVVPKLPMHISPQKSYNINDPSITPSKVKPRSPTAKEALARKMVKKAKSRANGKGSTLSFKRLMGDNGNLDNSSDFVETGKTFQPAVRKLRSRIVKKTAKDKVGKPASPDSTVAKQKTTGKTSSMPVDVEGKEGKTCLTCKQTIFGTEEAVKEHMRTCLRQRFVSDKHSSKQTRLRHLPEPAEEGSMELEVSDDESFARHLQQREDDKLMEEQLTDAEFYFCQICGRDLTHLNTVRRTQHINRCIDAMETEKKLHAEENVKDVPDCPICGKVLESRAQRQSHLKRCAVQYGVTTVQLLDLVKKQEAEMVRRKNQPRPRLQPAQLQQRGIKRHHEGPAGTAGKRPRKPARPVVSSRGPPGEGAPYREMDERTQVAMAMSMSLVNEESREQPTVMSALPVVGKEVKRRKKAAKTGEVPALLLTSKEDRDKSLAQKVASIIVQGDQESRPKTPSMRKSKLGRKYHTARKTMGKALSSPSFLQKTAAATTSSPPAASPSTAASPASSQEKAPLWSMSKRIDEKKTDDFYVQELSKQITPAKYVPVTPMRKAAKKAMMTFKNKSETDTSESETPDSSSTQKAVAGSQKARKTPTSPRTPVRKSRPTPTLTQRETASVLAELAEEGCSTQEVHDVFTEGQALSPEPSGFVPDRTPLSPQKMPSSVLSTALTKLSADFLGMVNSPKLSDLNLLCKNGEVLHVHKFVLVARCPVIAKMLETSKGDLAALDFSDHHKDAVLTTLQYLYGGKVALNGTVLAANVMRVAQKLELKELEDSCQAFLNTTFSPAASSPEFQEKELPELLDTMLGSPNSSPNLSQSSVNQSSDFNDSELEDIALSQKQRFQNPKITPSKNVNKEPAVTKKPTQMVPPAGRGLGQAPETQESGLHVPTMTVGDIVDSAIEKNVKQHASIGPDASLTSAAAYQQPLLASTGQTTGVRIPVEHSYSTSPRKGTQRGRRGPKTTVRPMMEGYATTISPVKQPASLAPSMQGNATAVTPSPRGSATTGTPSTHAVTSTTTLSSSQLGVGTAVTQASPAQTAMGALGTLPRPGVREHSLIFQSQELSSKLCCLECEKLGVRVSADEAQMLIQGGPAANAMRQLILARQGPCPHGKFPSWGPAVATTWTPPLAPEAVQGRAAGHLLAGLRTRTPPSSPVRQTAVVTTSAPGHIPTNPAHGHARGPPGPRMQNFAETRSPPFVPGLGRLAVPSMPPRPGGPQPDMRLPVPGSRMPIPPLPGFGMLPPSGRLPPASSLLPRTNILAQLREPSQYAQQRYGPQGVVQEPYPPQRKFPSPRDPTISPKSAQRSGKELDSPPTLSQGRSSPSTRLLLHTAQMMLPGNQYLSSPFFSPPGMQRPALHDGTPRLSVVAESSPPKNTSTAVVRIPAPTEKSQDRSERHISPPPAAVPTTAGGHVSNLTTSPSLDSTRRMPVRSSGGATFSSASLNSSTADMFAVPDTPPSSGRPRRRQGDKRGRGRTPSESDNDTRSAAEALMFMSQRREDSDGSDDVTPSPPGIPGTQVHSASSPKSVIVIGVSNAGGSPMPPSTPAVMHVSKLRGPEMHGTRSPLIRPQSWSSLVRREGSADESSILKVLLQKGVAAAIPRLYKDQEVPPHIQKQVLKETRWKKLKPKTKQHDVQPASQTRGEMVVGRNCSGEVHGGIVVTDTNNGEQMVTRESGAGLHGSHSGAQRQGREVVEGEKQHREVHDGSLGKQRQDELAGEESGTESLSCPTAEELRDSMLCRIIHPETFSPVPKIKGEAVHDRSEADTVQGKDLHAEKLTCERVLTWETVLTNACSPIVGEDGRHQKEGNGVAAVCVSEPSIKNVASEVEEDTDCDELHSTSTGPNTKRRRGKATTAATTLPSSSSATMSPHSSDASPMLRGTVEIVVNPGRGKSATGRQEPDIGKVPSIFDNSQENQVTIPNDQGNYRVTRRASQRKKQTTPTEDMMPSSQATNSVQTRSKGGKQKDEGKVTPSPTKRLRMRRPPEGKRHACTQSPKKFWTDYLKAQLASGYAPAGPVGESMMQTPDLSAVKPVRRGISSPELALTTPGMAGSTALQPKFSTPVGSNTQPVVSPRLSLDQELKEAETETVSHGTITEPAAPALENKRETSLDSTDSQQADGASKGGEQKEAAVTDSSVTPGKLQEASSSLNDSFTSTESEGSSVTRPGQLFVKTVQEGPAVIVQTQSELLSPTIDFHEETIVPRSVSPTPPQSPLTTFRSRVSSTASPPASPVIGPTPGQGQGSLLTGGSEIKSKDTPAAADEVIELSDDDDDDDDVQEREDLQDDAKRKRSTPDSESEAKRPKTDALESSVDEKDADHAESVADDSVDDDVGLEDVEKIDLTQEPTDEAASESQLGVCGTEHGCGTPEPEQPSSPSSQSKPAEEQQSQNSHPSVVNDSFMDFFDDGGYMEVPFGGEVECAADSSDDKINLSGVTSKTGGKDDQNTDDLNLSLDASPTKDSHTTPSSVPLSPKNASTVIEEFPDTQQKPVHIEEDAHAEEDIAEVVEESTSVGEDVVNNSMYDLEPYHEDNFWDESNEPQMDEPAAAQGVTGGVVGSGDTGTGTVKSTPLQTHHRSKAPLVPITPMPDYPNMETPELKKQVGKYGVRALKKPQMVAKLTEIYQYTHQLETDSEEDTPSAERTIDNHAELQHNRLYNRQTVIHEVPRIGEVVETVPCTDAAPGGSDVDSDGSTDSNSEGEEYEELSDDDDVTPSQQVDGGSLKGQLLRWVQDNKELYQKILQYEPIDAENLQQTLKSAGIRCSKNQLLDFLDEQCITFILPSSREKRLKKPRRKRKKKTPPAAAAVV
ncbi:mucin-17-like isoform X1 [Branchiostoma lanceolatum]|uniref:mucin-17-like isoform X1 n=1 Tax=Branchiostoma lanceolatum TaxID=7740 RepID=UPI00345686A5